MKKQLEHGIQHLTIQKQTMQRRRIELESALEELHTDEAWKVIGNIMVKKKPEVLKQELQEKLDRITQQLKHIEKQETRLQEKINEHANN